jgi:hypothetical protein
MQLRVNRGFPNYDAEQVWKDWVKAYFQDFSQHLSEVTEKEKNINQVVGQEVEI